MSIVAYTGLMGSGKTYGVLESVILPMLKQGRTIVTNVALKTGRVSDDFPSGRVISFDNDVTSEFFSSDNIVPGAVYVIDEAWRWFPSGIKANTVPVPEKQFFTEHRHYVGDDGFTCEIVLVTQNLNQVAMFVKALIEETYVSKKMGSLGQKNKFRIDIYQGVAEGIRPAGQPVRQLFGSYKPEIYQYYNSQTHNKTEYTNGSEQKVTDRTNIFKSWKFRFLFIGGPALLIFGIYSVQATIFDDQVISEEAAPVGALIPSDVTQSPDLSVEEVAAKSRRRVSKMSAPELARNLKEIVKNNALWKTEELHPTARITGFIGNDKKTRFYIESSNGRIITVDGRFCDYNQVVNEPYCVLDDKIVTAFSGSSGPSRSNSLSRASPDTNSETLEIL